MLKTLILEGRMAKKFGREHKFHVEDLREMLRAMCSQVPGFKRYLSEGHMKGIRFAFFNGKNNIGLDEFEMTRGGAVYRISAITEGSKRGGVLQIVIGAVALVAAYFTAGASFSAWAAANGISAAAVTASSTALAGIADPFRAGKQNGGRIRAVSGRNVTFDRPADYAAGDRLVVNLPDGKAQTRTIASISADKQTVTVTTPFRLLPESGAVWAIDSDNLAIQYFRVTSIRANDDSNGGFTITAVQHDPNKYRYIDDGVRITPAPVTVTPVSVLPAPKNIILTETDHIEQGLTVATMNASWDRVDGAIRYQAQWRKDNGDWINVPVSSAQGFSVQGIYSGSYDVRVRALNAQESSSPWGYADTTHLTGKAGRPGTPENLLASDNVIWNIDLTWSFPDGSGDTAYTEIQRSTTDDKANPLLLALVPYPATHYQHGPMRAGVSQWYRARLVDRIGNQSDWTYWVRGMSSDQASDYLDAIKDEVLSAEDGKALTEQRNRKYVLAVRYRRRPGLPEQCIHPGWNDHKRHDCRLYPVK